MIAGSDVVGRGGLVDVGHELGWGGELQNRHVAVLPGRGADAEAAQVEVGLAAHLRPGRIDHDLHQVDRDGHLLIVRESTLGDEQAQELPLRAGHRPRLRKRQVVGKRDLRRQRGGIEDRIIRLLRVAACVVADAGLAGAERGGGERGGGDTSKQHWLPPRRGE